MNTNELDELNKKLDDMSLDLNELITDEDLAEPGETVILPSNDVIENKDDLTLGLSKDEVYEFYDYLSGKTARPQFAERFFADSEARIKESNQLTTLMGLSFVPKLLAMEQSLINSISSPETLKYLSIDEKLSYLQTFAAISTKFNEMAMNYTKLQRDLGSTPLIYRQLLDQLMLVPNEKLPRLKAIPKIVDLDEDTWNRIMEIIDL